MDPKARDQYLVTDVQTATAEKRQLLLVEGTLRLANRARQYWQEGRNELALPALLEAQEIIAHMLGVIDQEAGGEMAQRVSAVYEFIYRSLVQAGYKNDDRSLGDAIRILEIERQTWRQLCERAAIERSARPAAPYANFGAPLVHDEDEFSGGFSLEV